MMTMAKIMITRRYSSSLPESCFELDSGVLLPSSGTNTIGSPLESVPEKTWSEVSANF